MPKQQALGHGSYSFLSTAGASTMTDRLTPSSRGHVILILTPPYGLSLQPSGSFVGDRRQVELSEIPPLGLQQALSHGRLWGVNEIMHLKLFSQSLVPERVNQRVTAIVNTVLVHLFFQTIFTGPSLRRKCDPNTSSPQSYRVGYVC